MNNIIETFVQKITHYAGFSSILSPHCSQTQSLPCITTAIRSLRSSAHGTFDGVKLNSAKPKQRPAQETVEDPCESEIVVSKGNLINKAG